MAGKKYYSVTRVPSDDWDNIMETVTLDGSYSEEIKDEVWTAIENMEDFSLPWVVVKVENGKASVRIFSNEEAARKYTKKLSGKSSQKQVFCTKGQYQS